MSKRESDGGIGELNERPLHAALKHWYSEPGDRLEVPMDGYVIDIVRDDLLIEIQTRHFSAIRQKIADLSQHHRLRLVYPIAHEKWLIKRSVAEGESITRRKSPKRGRVEDLFGELVSFPSLVSNDNFTLEVLLTREEEVRRHEPGRAWRRRGWVTEERRLLDVAGRHVFETPRAVGGLLPDTLPDEFTTADIAEAMSVRRRLAQQAAYCLRTMGLIESVGKRGRAILYVRADACG